MVTDDNGRSPVSCFVEDPAEPCGYSSDDRVSQRRDLDTTNLETGTATTDDGSDSPYSHPPGRRQKGHSNCESQTSNSNDTDSWNTSPRTPPLEELPSIQHQADERSWIKWRRRATTTTVDNDDPNWYCCHHTPRVASPQLPPSQTGMMSAPIQLPTWQVLKENISTLDLSLDDYGGNDDDCDDEQFLWSDRIKATSVETNMNTKKRRVPNQTKQLSLPFTPSLFD